MFLQACHHQAAVKPIVPGRVVDLTAVDNYQLDGKMSFSDGQDGGSGSIQWQNQAGLISVSLKAPLGSRSWRLSEQIEGAELWANGETVYADSAQTLISDQLGWQVPWEQLKSWVIGQAHHKNQGQLVWQTGGFILSEDGWQIEYSRMKSYPSDSLQRLPHKMVARKGNYAIKLSIKKWSW